MLRWIVLAATRYAERLLELYVQDILYTLFNENFERNKELKLASITNPTPVYLEQPSPIPASAAADQLGDVVNDLHFLNV